MIYDVSHVVQYLLSDEESFWNTSFGFVEGSKKGTELFFTDSSAKNRLTTCRLIGV